MITDKESHCTECIYIWHQATDKSVEQNLKIAVA